jgi:predicted PurR-regulated permease PerM
MTNNNPRQQIDISMKTIWRIIFVILLIIFLYNIKEILAIVFVAWVLASALDPLVDKLQKYKIPRFVSILAIYILLIAILVLIFFLFIPPLTQEISVLAKELPKYYQPVIDYINNFKKTSVEYGYFDNVQKALEGLGNTLTSVTSGLYNAATGFIGGIAMIFAVLVITFYMTVQEEGMKKFMLIVTPINYQPFIMQKINKIQRKLGSWLWGQIVLMICVGVMCGIALKIIGIPYVLILAIFAGFCEFIPIVGPIISAIPAVLFSLTVLGDSPLKPVLVIIAYIVIQQIENQLLVPKIMNKAVGLNPIIVIITMLIGAKIGGVIGIVLAIPAATIIGIFLEDFFAGQKEEANKLEGEEYIKKL